MKLVVSLLAASLAAGPTPERFQFGLIGDLPYNAIETTLFRDLMTVLDGLDLAFVVHDGDLKSGTSPCSDDVFLARRALLDRSAHPLVFLFGDNDWTDCHQARSGGFDPLDRLARLRGLFATSAESLGRRRMPLERQTDGYPENVRWRSGNVRFVGLHVVGSGNNRGRTEEMDREYSARTQANLAWLREAFALARDEGALGVVVLFQADPRFDLPRGSAARRGFDETGFAPTIIVVEAPGPFVGTTYLDALPYENVDLSRLYPFGTPEARRSP